MLCLLLTPEANGWVLHAVAKKSSHDHDGSCSRHSHEHHAFLAVPPICTICAVDTVNIFRCSCSTELYRPLHCAASRGKAVSVRCAPKPKYRPRFE
jgi:hypothetical protein